MPKMAATPMIMWKWPTTKYVSWKYRSSAGCPRKMPLTPPVTKSETKPSANSMAVVKWILPPHSVPIQLKVLMAEGTPMHMVKHQRVIVVEVMGRDSGWIAMYSGIAGGADVILIPERPFDIEEVAERIRMRHARGRYFSIVVVAEGAKFAADGAP